MTWSAFFNAMGRGVQSRIQSVRQGVTRVTQTPVAQRPATAQRAAVSTQAATNKAGAEKEDFDFLVMDVSATTEEDSLARSTSRLTERSVLLH